MNVSKASLFYAKNRMTLTQFVKKYTKMAMFAGGTKETVNQKQFTQTIGWSVSKDAPHLMNQSRWSLRPGFAHHQ